MGKASCNNCSAENKCDKYIDEPVCGSDWRDYQSPCHVKKESCSSNQNITIKYKGMCSKF